MNLHNARYALLGVVGIVSLSCGKSDGGSPGSPAPAAAKISEGKAGAAEREYQIGWRSCS